MLRAPRAYAAALALLVGARARAAEPGAAGPAFEFQFKGRAGGGAFKGLGLRPDGAGAATADLDADPALRWGSFRLALPLALSHRQTLGASLVESRGRAELELRWRPSARLRATASLGAGGVWRPGWADLYQPLAQDGFTPTSRHSYWERRAEAQLAAIPIGHHHARLKYRYTLSDYANDPAFDPLFEPTHLVPLDHEEHRLDLSWRFLGKGFKLGGGAEAYWRQYFFAFARDAGTGATHASPGGPPPNPLQVLRGVEPQLEGELKLLDDRLELSARYGVEIANDAFQGYYSFLAHHPEFRVDWAVHSRVSLVARAEARWRLYGPWSYAAGPDHPPLLWGDRRTDVRGALDLEVRVALGNGFFAVLDLRGVLRRTNYPPYVPGVFPATRQYDIRWDYENASALLALEYAYETGAAERGD